MKSWANLLLLLAALPLLTAACSPSAPSSLEPRSSNSSSEAPSSGSTSPESSPSASAHSAPGLSASGDAAQDVFVDQAAARGLGLTHFNGMSGEYYIVEEVGAGSAWIDVDGDGDLDLYWLQGAMLGDKDVSQALFPPSNSSSNPLGDRLFLNQLDAAVPDSLKFIEQPLAAGLGEGHGMGIAAGDFDNDGNTDLYVTRFGANRLLRNQGDGTFADATASSGAEEQRWSVAAAFFDYDRDGHLDLFVGNYLEVDLERMPVCKDMAGRRDYCGPGNFLPQGDRLLRNLGDGRFQDATKSAGFDKVRSPTLGVVVVDVDEDGWLDLYVANDGDVNNLWMNRGDGTFEDRALLAGVAVNRQGQAEAGMGVDAGDFDGDGDLDLFLSHFITESNTLYRNDGGGLFTDVSASAKLAAPSRAFTAFGVGWLDYDHDGWLDLMVVNGTVNRIEALARAGDPYPMHQPNQLFRNLGDGVFEERTKVAGAALELSEVSRGASFGDVDNDGDTDVLVTNNSGQARLLLRTGEPAAWLGLRLLTGDPPRDDPGARAAVAREDSRTLWRRVRLEGSYASASDPRLRFALDNSASRRVRVIWSDGQAEEWPAVDTGRYTSLRRGTGEEAKNEE